MTPFTPFQELFFRSIVENAFQNQDGSIRLSVEAADSNFILVAVQRQDDQSPFHIIRDKADDSDCLDSAEAIQQILTTLTESRGTLRIERGNRVERVSLKSGKIVRETSEKRPKILKDPTWAIGKSTHLDPDRAAPLLQAIGLMTDQGEIKAPMRKKFKQVNHFIELLYSYLPQDRGKKPYTIVDCGCGKSYLGFVLFWYIRHVLNRPAIFWGIDIAPDRIDHCQNRAQRLGLNSMQFACVSNREAILPESIDLLISLHACDTATDEALALAVAHNARHIASAPCCQHELAAQLDGVPHYPLAKHGLFKHRFADLLTDMMRCLFLEAHGYSVTVGEFVSVEETPKNLLIRAKQGNRNAEQRMAEYEAFKTQYKIAPSIDTLLWELKTR